MAFLKRGRRKEERERRKEERKEERKKERRKRKREIETVLETGRSCLLYTSPSPRDLSTSRMPSSA